MSLLLDALKRAEEAKRAKQSIDAVAATPETPATRRTELPPASPDLSLEDYKEIIPARSSARPSVPARSDAGQRPRGAELSIEELPEAKSPGSPHVAAATSVAALQTRLDSTQIDAEQSRDTARNVFTAKQPQDADEGSRKKWLLPVIVVVVAATGGGGWYVWNEVNRVSRPAALNLASRPASPLAPARLATGQSGAGQQADAGPKSAPVEPALPPLLPPPAEHIALPKLALPTSANAGPPPTQREALAKSLKDAPASKEVPLGLMLARSADAPAVSADLLEAYASLRNADYARARALYAKLVLADPLNADVQLGMATAFARAGDPVAAARHYRQVLVIDPRNGAALAGLLAVSDARSPSLEIELRTLVSRNPETSSLRFTLGNLYASERRWLEAQQAYFEAFRLEPENADYLYNLAVSLDHLKQSRLALDYYRKALAAALKSGAQFDPSVVTRRIKDLQVEFGSN